MNYAIDSRTVRAMTREAERVRAIRLDKPAIEVIQFARQEAQRDCLDALMREVPTERKA